MDAASLRRWFAANGELLETAYLKGEQPWQQSGFGLHSVRTYECWDACRRPVADAIDRSGTFLDIGCANGYLLECVLGWTAARGLAVEPYGLDFSERLVALARRRLPDHAGHFFAANAWDWQPPRRFDVVRTELEYVPEELQATFVDRLLGRFVTHSGVLLVAEYRGRDDTAPLLTIDRRLAAWGFAVEAVTRGVWEGTEYTRVARVRAATSPNSPVDNLRNLRSRARTQRTSPRVVSHAWPEPLSQAETIAIIDSIISFTFAADNLPAR